MCKSDVEIVRLVGRHGGCQFLNYNKANKDFCAVFLIRI